MSDNETLRVYGAKAEEYAALTDNDTQATRDLLAFIEMLPAGGEVLDLGCGPGASAAAMARAGLQVTAIDAVPEMVELAARHEGVAAQLGTFDDIDGEEALDGVWANFSLLHAPRSDVPRHLNAIARALRPGGVFHIGVKTGIGEARDRIGRLYTYFTDEELTGLLADAGLRVISRRTGTSPGLSGEDAPWITMRAVKDA
jgi:trans-aconitate methyltransferase